jgi:hypothetical protein
MHTPRSLARPEHRSGRTNVDTLTRAGLSEQEVAARRRRGEGTALVVRSSHSSWDIVRTNRFTFFNLLLVAIGVALIALGQYGSASFANQLTRTVRTFHIVKTPLQKTIDVMVRLVTLVLLRSRSQLTAIMQCEKCWASDG